MFWRDGELGRYFEMATLGGYSYLPWQPEPLPLPVPLPGPRWALGHGETTNVIKRDAKVTRATRAQISSFMRPPLRIFADPFIVVFT